mmetsp:Transcript_65572/g.154188  ORF Transcript_65572/g.154188 Transcript_65572/m.154188 type:complete len:615 (+) Transcript_65572:65-1909(+)
MARWGVLLFWVLLQVCPSAVTAAKVSVLRSKLLESAGLSRPLSRRELRALGTERLKASVVSLKQEVGELEVALKKAKTENAASLEDLEKSLDKTRSQFPKRQPLRSPDEKKLDANIAKTEALIGDVYQFTLAHAKVAETARAELEKLAKILSTCNCSKKPRVSFLQLQGSSHRAPYHLTEEQIAEMVQDLGTGFASEQAETRVDSTGGTADDGTTLEDLVRQVEELERKRDSLEEARAVEDQAFQQAQSSLLDRSRKASKELFAAKIQAGRQEEDAATRARALARQHKYASAMLSDQEARLKRVKMHISNYTARIKSAASLIKGCGCLKKGEEIKVWEPPEVTSTTTTTFTTTTTAGEKKAETAAAKTTTTTTLTTTSTTGTKKVFTTTFYNSWDADMENSKLGDADILFYEAPAGDVKEVAKDCLFTAGSHARDKADVNKMWCYPGPYWGLSEKPSSDKPDGKGNVKDMSLLPPSDKDGKKSIVLRFEVPRDGVYTLDLFGAKRFKGGKGFVNVLFYVKGEEEEALDHVSDGILPTSENGENKVHELGQLAGGSFLHFAVNNAGDGADDDDTKLRFRLKAVTKDTTSALQEALASAAASQIEAPGDGEDGAPR